MTNETFPEFFPILAVSNIEKPVFGVLMVDDMFVLANWMESPRDHVPSGEAAPVPPSPGTRS